MRSSRNRILSRPRAAADHHRPLRRRRRAGAIAAVFAILAASLTFMIAPTLAMAAGSAVIPNSTFTSFTDVQMQRTDDGSWPAVFPFGFNINYFGTGYPGAYINNNGNLTFTGPLSTYSPFGLGGASTPIIAPFFADVDTVNGNTVNIGTGLLNGFHVFVANWPGVRCYPATNSSVLDNFQVILIDRPDLGTGVHGDDFQIEFNYNSIQWDAGTASNGDANCTHSANSFAASVGYSDGTATAGHWYQLPGSQASGALLDSNTSSGLIYNELNSNAATSVPPSVPPVLGRYIFSVNNGQPVAPTTVATSLKGGGNLGSSISVPPNTAVSDTATISGPNAATAGGTVGYSVYSDNLCTALVMDGGTVTVTGGVVPVSNGVTLSALGKYYWLASYSGDTLNGASTSGCAEVETVAIPPATVSTSVDDSVLGSTWNGSETTSAKAYDTASVSGFTGFIPTGTVTYNGFVNGTCAGSPATTETVTMSAGTAPNSSTTAALGAGAYSFLAAYSGDSAYASATSACEPFTVAKAAASSGTVVDDAALSSAWNGNEATGAAAYDTATVAGIAGFTPGGTVIYTFFINATCAGSPATTRAVSFSGGTVPNSSTTSPLAAGSYAFKAAYSGDGNYQASTSACEPFSVLRTASGVGTVVDDAVSNAAWNGSETIAASAYDTATVAATAGFTPTGTVNYSFFANATCAGSPSTTRTMSLSGGNVPDSPATGPLAAGTYSFAGSYSGDANYEAATGSCEPFSVVRSTSGAGTVVDDAATNAPWAGTETVGAFAYDTAALTSVAGFIPTGTVTYSFYTNGNCTGGPSTTDTVSLSGGNVPHSSPTGALTSGPHGFDASYSGDANYRAANATCESFNVYAAPMVTSADHVTFIVGAVSSFTVRATGFPSGAAISLSVVGATLPTGVSFVDNGDGTASLAGTPAVGTVGSYPFIITVTNGIGPDGTQSFVLTDAPGSTTTVLSSPANPSVVTQSVTLTATVSVTAPSSGSPTGTVSFADNLNPIAGCTSQPVTSGTAACTTAFATAADHPLTAAYSGDANFAASNAGQLTQHVDAATTTAVTVSSANPGVTGQGVTYTATVSRSAPATGSAGGTFAFTDGGSPIAGCAGVVVTAEQSTCSEVSVLTGVHMIVATFSGDANDLNSTAPPLTEQIQRDPTMTTVTSSPNASTAGDRVTITVTVKASLPGSGNPTGTVAIRVDGKALSTVVLDSTVDSRAVYATSTLAIGTHAITATYSGDSGYSVSTSATADSQRVIPRISPPDTGGRSGWLYIAALSLLMNGLALVAWSRRRSRS